MHLGGKLGPLPTWAWGLVILGGLGLGLYLRRHSSSSPTASIVSQGGPASALGSGGGGSDGGGTSGVSTGMDPLLAQLLSDSQSALVNESGVLAGLASAGVDGALQAAGAAIGLATTVATTPPVIYTIGASPAGSSPAGTSSTPSSTPTTPLNPPVNSHPLDPGPRLPPVRPTLSAAEVAAKERAAHAAAVAAQGSWTAGF